MSVTGIPGDPPIPASKIQSTDWKARFDEIQKKNNSNRFVNYRYNLNNIQKSFAGCVGTDEDGRPQVQFDNLCNPNNMTNSNPCRIDDNYHTPDTCKLNVSMIDSKKRFDALSTGTSMYEPGLRYTVYDGAFKYFGYEKIFMNNPTTVSNGFSKDFSSLEKAIPNPPDSSMFTVEWFGYFKPPAPGSYTIKIWADDEAFLFLDDAANNPKLNSYATNYSLLSVWNNSPQQVIYEARDTNYHPIRIWFEQVGGDKMFAMQILGLGNLDILSSSNGWASKYGVSPNTKCLFSSNLDTYYSLIRNEKQPDLYNCYMTNSQDTVERSRGKQYVYRTLISFQYTVDGRPIPNTPSMYAAVGDDGTIQIYDAAKSGRDIDFTGTQVRDGNHPDFICRINQVTNQNGAAYIIDDSGKDDNFCNILGLSTVNGLPIFNSSPDWISANSDAYKNAKRDALPVFFMNSTDFTYNNTNYNWHVRWVIAHKNNPYNKSGRNFHLISNQNKFKFRMNDQGDLRLIYAVSACRTVNDNGQDVIYTETPQSIAFYNVIGDPRVNHSFYYDGSDNTLSYIDKAKYPDLYSYNKNGTDYTKYNDIYIPKIIKDDANAFINTVVDQSGCESACNSNENCGFYYYESNPKKCYVDTGKYKPQFTPSSDPSGSRLDNIRANPSALYVKEQAVNVNPLLSSDVDINDLETNYKKYSNAKTTFNGALFAVKFPENTPRYGDPEMTKLRTEEISWNYEFYPGGYDKNNVLQQTVSSGVTKSGFVGSGSGNKEGFSFIEGEGNMNENNVSISGSGIGGETSTLTVMNLSASGAGPGPGAGSGPGPGAGAGAGGSAATPYTKPITQGTTVSVSSAIDNNGNPVTESVNNVPWEKFVANERKQIIQESQSPNVAFYDTIKLMMESTLIHLPMYKIEYDSNNYPCFLNRAFFQTNYGRDGNIKDGLKIISTKADLEVKYINTPKYHGMLVGSFENSEKNDDRLPFSSGYIEFNNALQWITINQSISYPNTRTVFSFYFKLSPMNGRHSWDKGKPRIFDFSNGVDQDNISAMFTVNNNGGMNLAFGCRGINVYFQRNVVTSTKNGTLWFEDYFENVDDGKWHFCQWIMELHNVDKDVNGVTKNGLTIEWQLSLHTLNDDNTIDYEYFTIFDSTFSRYKNEYEKSILQKNGYIDRIANPNEYISTNPKQDINVNEYNTDVTEVNGNVVDASYYPVGYDNVCIVQNIKDVGSIWVPRYSHSSNKKYALHPYKHNTCKVRLSYPVVPTTINFIAGSPWYKNICNCDLYFAGACGIRDFKMMSDPARVVPETPILGNFSWCVDNKNAAIIRTFSGYNVNQIWKYMPIVTDNNTGVFSNSKLPYKFMSPALKGNTDSSRLTKYDPNITNNVANFIYSQIIYKDNAEKMLKPYLANIAKQKDSFQNIEGFTSFREGATFDESIREPKLNQYYPPLMYNVDTQFGKDKKAYLKQLKQVSINTNALQPYLVNNEARYNELKNAKDNYYDFSGNELLYYNKKDQPSILDTRISDYQEYVIQQNSVYIIGTITCASMILAAIILGRQ
jgi:hypothetical protein